MATETSSAPSGKPQPDEHWDEHYRDERDVHALAKAIDWKRHFRADRTLRVDVAATRSPLPSLEFIARALGDKDT